MKTRKSYPKKDLRNQKFGNLEPIEWIRGGKWKCICDCGNETVVDTRNLISGHTTSCGCNNYKSKNCKDMTGYEDNNLIVLSREENSSTKIARWLCICKHCGRPFVTKGSNIRNLSTTSCGCTHSHNEEKITKMLLASNVEFASQYTFSDLLGSGGKKLRFDFAIFSNGKLKHLIEFNGLQHYKKAQGKWGEYYETLKENDQLKIKYCKEHRIILKTIKYDEDYTIEDLID